MIPDPLELCERPVLAAKHPRVQLGFSLHGITKLTLKKRRLWSNLTVTIQYLKVASKRGGTGQGVKGQGVVVLNYKRADLG